MYLLIWLNDWQNASEAVSDLDSFAEKTLENIGYLVGLVVSFILLIAISARRKNLILELDRSFSAKPWLYDNKVVQLSLQVDVVFRDTTSEKFKRKLSNILRNIT